MNSCATWRLNSMLWEWCLAMAFILRKPSYQVNSLRAAALEPVKDWSQRLKLRRVRFQAHRHGIVLRAQRKYDRVKFGTLRNNAGIKIGRAHV